MKLLNVDANAKTVKGQKYGFITGVMYLAPHDLSGTNLCPFAKMARCADTCLHFQGRAAIAKAKATMVAPNGNVIPDNSIQRCRIKRTEWFLKDREAFMQQLIKEINSLKRKAAKLGLVPVIRLNGTSDIRWENVKLEDGRTIFEVFPDLQFYDYTKLSNRVKLPSNYHLSWSYSNASKRFADMRPSNLNWVVVFRNAEFPKTYLGRPVIDGDESDLRFLDPSNVVIALKAKGSAKKDMSGFIVDAP